MLYKINRQVFNPSVLISDQTDHCLSLASSLNALEIFVIARAVVVAVDVIEAWAELHPKFLLG